MKPPGSVLRETLSTLAHLCYRRGRYSDTLDDENSQDSGRFWLSYFLSTRRVVGYENKIVRIGLACVSQTPHGQKLTRAHTPSLSVPPPMLGSQTTYFS